MTVADLAESASLAAASANVGGCVTGSLLSVKLLLVNSVEVEVEDVVFSLLSELLVLSLVPADRPAIRRDLQNLQ